MTNTVYIFRTGYRKADRNETDLLILGRPQQRGDYRNSMAKESRYILVEKLARGGMAEIYLGCSSSEDGFKRVCCIKRILPHFSQEKEYIEMFRDEAHICKRLQHANIVRVEGFEEVDDSFAIIMEFIDGADLRKILVACENAGTALPIPMALYITAEIARGLHYAHTKIDDITLKPLSIVHRDISPQNILVSFEGEAKITDFGIADADNKSTETKPGIVKGKYSYMSPEQIMAKQVDSRTDIFALAIVLWEMISMERLFHGENDVITIQKVKNCEIKRIPRGQKRKKGEVDDELEAIILSGLQKDLKKRYQDGKSFEAALRKYLNKNYPEFGPEELSTFMKDLLADERAKSAIAIKRALTAEDLKSSKVKVPVKIYDDDDNSKKSKGVDFNLADAKSNHEFSIARSVQMQGSMIQNRPAGGSASSPAASNHRKNLSNLQPATGMKPQQTLPYYPKRTNSKFLLLVIAAVFAIGSISVIAKRIYTARKAPAILKLRTIPANVKLTLDGKQLYNGRYTQTPLKEKIRHGRHELIISRDGFINEKINLLIESGTRIKKIEIALKKKSKFAPVRLRIGDPSVDKVWTNIDRGMDIGFAPRKVDDLTYGRTHTLKVYPNYPRRKNRFTCTFKPRSRSWRAPYVVVIYPRSKRCAYSTP